MTIGRKMDAAWKKAISDGKKLAKNLPSAIKSDVKRDIRTFKIVDATANFAGKRALGAAKNSVKADIKKAGAALSNAKNAAITKAKTVFNTSKKN